MRLPFRQIGIENIEWTSLNEVKQVSSEQREAWLAEIERRFAGPMSSV